MCMNSEGKRLMLFAVLCILNLSFFPQANAQDNYVPGELIVRFADKEPITIKQAQNRLDEGTIRVVESLFPSLNIFLLKTQDKLSVPQAIQKLSATTAVLYSLPNHILESRNVRIPNDSQFSKQWSLKNNVTANADIHATEAWELGTGGKDPGGNDIVVAVVDPGVDITHPELSPNIWTNTDEIPDNKIDDDGDGYIDDVRGWNAKSNSGNVYNAKNNHGTFISGIIGASGNNGKGITGVNWDVKIMPVFNSNNVTSVVIKAYNYVTTQKRLWLESNGKKGANIVSTNSSFGGSGDCRSDSRYKVWNDLYDEMGKVGILSAVATANDNVDVDTAGDIPSSCPSDFVISVTSTTKDDHRKQAGYGATTIDLGAPGEDIYSTFADNQYAIESGTSFSTPLVAGSVALLHNVSSQDFYNLYINDPPKAALILKKMILDGTDTLADLQGKTVSGGRLNLFNSAKLISSFRNILEFNLTDKILFNTSWLQSN